MQFHTLFPWLRRSSAAGLYLFLATSLVAGFLPGCEEEKEPLPAAGILESRPLTPTDQNLFSSVAYPNATLMTPATTMPPTDAQVRQLLETYLQLDGQSVQAGMALYDDSALIFKVPNPSLRAGLVALHGTAGEPAIEFIFHAKTDAGLPMVIIVGFDDNPWAATDQGIARVIGNSLNQMAIVFDPKYKAENPFLFSCILAHEALHSDFQVAGFEEITNKAIESSIYLEQLAKHSELSETGTELSRRNNTNALTRLNSGEGARLGLFSSLGNKPVLPGSPFTFTSWYAQFPQTDLTETPGNMVLIQILGNMAPGRSVPTGTNFNMATLQFIDQYQTNLPKEELIKAAQMLKLVPQ